MSDINVVVGEVDAAMDMLEAYSKEADDIRAQLTFDLSSVFSAVDLRIENCRRRIVEASYDNDNSCFAESFECDTSIDNICFLEEQLEQLIMIKAICADYGQSLADDMKSLFMKSDELIRAGMQEMGRYISKLNLLPEQGSKNSFSTVSTDNTYVCVIDSRRYPQTAEHIRTAQCIGFPAILMLDRDRAAERRKASLENVRINKLYDRDEYPCAVFSEGGSGADVVYIVGSDNRGAGSYMRWQMRNMPDGSRVRIRIV